MSIMRAGRKKHKNTSRTFFIEQKVMPASKNFSLTTVAQGAQPGQS